MKTSSPAVDMNLVDVQVAQPTKSCPVALVELIQIIGINNNILKERTRYAIN